MLKKLLTAFYRQLLKTRYNVEIKNAELLKYDGLILIFPNHVALVDPQILVSFFTKYTHISPLASRAFYDKTGIKQVMDLFDTIPIEDLQTGGDKDKIKHSLSGIIKGLEKNKKILLYPSGQIYRQGFEVIRGKQLAYQVCNLSPENTKVFGVKTRGLWGSMYSMAYDNGKSSIWKLFLLSFWYILANFIFFVPKRKISIEIVDITKQVNTYKKMSLNEFNGFLENFYNKEGEEKTKFISHYFYYNDVKNKKESEIITGSLKDLQNSKKVDLSQIPEDIKKDVFDKIKQMKEIEKVDKNQNLVIDLYFDSLDMAETKSYIQSRYSTSSNPPITSLKSVGDLLIMAVGKSENEEKLKPCNWQKWEQKGDLIEKII